MWPFMLRYICKEAITSTSCAVMAFSSHETEKNGEIGGYYV